MFRYGIVFTTKDYRDLPKHYIFALDTSYSMKGDPIDALLSAIERFIAHKCSERKGIQHTVSGILFEAEARIAFTQADIGRNLFMATPECRGSTNFSAALQKVVYKI